MSRRFRGPNRAGKTEARRPQPPSEKFQQALALHQQGKADLAKNLYEKVLAGNPTHFDSLHLLGVALWQLGQPEAGADKIRRAISVNENYAPAHNNLGNVLRDLRQLGEALACYERALQLNPVYPEAHNNRGNVLRDMGQFEQALQSYEKAIGLKSDFVEAHNNRGNALTDLNRTIEALQAYEDAIAIRPAFAEAHSNRGQALLKLKRYHEAEASCRNALSLRPDFSDAYNNLGNILKDMRRLDEAVECYDHALALKPVSKEVLNNRGVALAELKRLDEAIADYDKALGIDPFYASAYTNRGNAERDQRKFEEAIISYRKSLELMPENEFLFGTYVQTKLKICDWSTLEDDIKTIKKGVAESRKTINPFVALVIQDDPQLHLKVAQHFGNTLYPASCQTAIAFQKDAPKIKIGYYSADYYNHATSFLMAQLFELHDRERFEVYGFTFSPQVNDDLQKRVFAAFDRVIDVSHMSDAEVASLSRRLGIDIAVDLKGYTTDARTGIFAERCASIQVNYLGYPGTMGVDYMDYVIVDRVVVPTSDHHFFTEKLAFLPNSYQVNESSRKVSGAEYTRRDVGLPEEGFVFCCFNNNHKILPEMFRIWMGLLKKVPGSVLWLLEDNPVASRNLRSEAERLGVGGYRLVFAKRTRIDDHLSRHVLADLFLDTLPYNAHTTASDALWCEVPVLTLLGNAFAGRVAASLLTALNLDELICETKAEYEAKALEIALNPQKLADIRQKIAVNKQAGSLFNAELFTRQIEDLYTRMIKRRDAGLEPAMLGL